MLLRKMQHLNPHLDSHHLDWSNEEEEEGGGEEDDDNDDD
jgi:hypothetical protein